MQRIQSFIQRFKSNKTLVNGGLFSLFSFINRGMSFLLLILLANYIAPAEYGQLSLFNTFVTFVMYFIALCTQGFLSVSYFQRTKEDFNRDVSTISAITTICALILCILLFFLNKPVAELMNIPSKFLWIALAICFLNIFWELFVDYLRVQEKVGKYGLFSCSFAAMNFILSLFLVINRDLNWSGRVYAQLCSCILFGVFSIIYFSKKRIFTLDLSKDRFKYIILWGLPLIPHLATNWLKQGADRIIINGCHTIDDVGIFSFALNLTSVIIMLGTAFNASNSVTIYQILSSSSDNKYKELQRQTRNIFLIYVVGIAFIILGAVIFVPILLPKYVGAIPYFLILSVYGFLQCLYFLYCNYLFYYNKNKQIMMVTFFTAALHLGLSLVLTRYSLFLTCCIYIFTQLIVVVLIKRKSNKVLIENKILKYE